MCGVSLLAGCGQSGPELATVAGDVRFDGKPLRDVLVEFQPTAGKGSPSIGYTDQAGHYELRFSASRIGAMPGEHLVRINHDYDPGSGEPKPEFKIPREYNAKSTLKREVAKGENTIDFDLNSKQTTDTGRPAKRVATVAKD
jgi:hypothetical protein